MVGVVFPFSRVVCGSDGFLVLIEVVSNVFWVPSKGVGSEGKESQQAEHRRWIHSEEGDKTRNVLETMQEHLLGSGYETDTLQGEQAS